MRTIIIGDIHGCDQALRDLLKKIRKNALTGLQFKLRLGEPLTLEEKAFWEENNKSPLDE